MKRWLLLTAAIVLATGATAWGAYHHAGEDDAKNFIAVYSGKKGTKLDHCALCHKGGEVYNKKKDKYITMGSCQYCHEITRYGADEPVDWAATLNSYGTAYNAAGRNEQAITNIKGDDSDNDGHTNDAEIVANSYPGDDKDKPGMIQAPFKVYTRAELEALGAHTQFMVMNTSRSGDFYAQYTGVPMNVLLKDAGMKPGSTNVKVMAPDGWSQDHPVTFKENTVDEKGFPIYYYHLTGRVPGQSFQYPQGTYQYHEQADKMVTPSVGWCDYSAPSCSGRVDGGSIYVKGGLKAMLAYKREGAYLEPGVLSDDNKLDGEGPFRLVVPQKVPGPPDQSSRSDNQDVHWPHNDVWDHNAGACTRSATIIKVEPLPEGTTDINILEAGWNFIDQDKVVVYGNIDPTDSNGNGILDAEEKLIGGQDTDEDGVKDYQDSDSAAFLSPKSEAVIKLAASSGELKSVMPMEETDQRMAIKAIDGRDFPYGVVDFRITGLNHQESVTVKIVYPVPVPEDAKYHKVVSGVWGEIPFERIDQNTILITLKDGDPKTDADGLDNGEIRDPGGISIPSQSNAVSSDDGGCFIGSLP